MAMSSAEKNVLNDLVVKTSQRCLINIKDDVAIIDLVTASGISPSAYGVLVATNLIRAIVQVEDESFKETALAYVKGVMDEI